jgi:hypothetical protein
VDSLGVWGPGSKVCIRGEDAPIDQLR